MGDLNFYKLHIQQYEPCPWMPRHKDKQHNRRRLLPGLSRDKTISKKINTQKLSIISPDSLHKTLQSITRKRSYFVTCFIVLSTNTRISPSAILYIHGNPLTSCMQSQFVSQAFSADQGTQSQSSDLLSRKCLYVRKEILIF